MMPVPPRNYDASASVSPWFRFGRLLPAVLRHRVFEPAYFDLLAEHQRRGQSHKRLGFKVFGLALEAYRVGGPSLLWDLRRTSRKAPMLVLLLIIVALTALMITNYQYGDTPPYNPSGTP